MNKLRLTIDRAKVAILIIMMGLAVALITYPSNAYCHYCAYEGSACFSSYECGESCHCYHFNPDSALGTCL